MPRALVTAAAFLMVIAFCEWPLLRPGIFEGWDIRCHLMRIQSLAEALREHIFLARFHASMGFGYGYGIGFFYPDFFLYIPAVLILMGVSLEAAYKIFSVLIWCAMFWCTYYSVRKLTRSHGSALFAAAVYVCSHEILAVQYVNNDVGAMTGSIFLPLAFISMYLLMTRGDYAFQLAVAFTGMILSHTLTAFMAFIVCCVIMLVYAGNLIHHRERLLKLLTAVIGTLIVTCWYWLPMWEQFRVQTYQVATPWEFAREHLQSLEGYTHKEVFNFMATIVGVITGVVLLLRKKDDRIILFSGLSAAIMLIAAFYPFWYFMEVVLHVQLLQVTDRLMRVVAACTAISIGCISADLTLGHRVKQGATVAVIVLEMVLTFTGLAPLVPAQGMTYLTDVEAGNIAGFGAGNEWLPLDTDRDKLTNPETAYDSNGRAVQGQKLHIDNQYVFTANISRGYYDVPYIYYRGFQAIGQNGQRYEVDKGDRNGLLRVFMPQNGKGTDTITVSYKGTKYQRLSHLITILGILIIAGIYVAWRRVYSRNTAK